MTKKDKMTIEITEEMIKAACAQLPSDSESPWSSFSNTHGLRLALIAALQAGGYDVQNNEIHEQDF
jgi:hypothetical protein